MAKQKDIADLVEEAIDRGATTVEEIHKAIADLPLKVLEEIQILKKPIREFRRVQDRSIGVVYDLIRQINERINKLASNMLRKRKAPVRRRKAPATSARASRART